MAWRMTAVTWTASAAGLTRALIAGTRAATAASAAWDRAQSRSRPSIDRRLAVNAGAGRGMSQPVRCATTDSSAHKVIRGSVTMARCAARIWPSMHGPARQSGPQVGLRGPITGPAEAVTAGLAASRALPSGIRTSSG
jgi:hypothetical protein